MKVSRNGFACKVLGQARLTQRRGPHAPDDEPLLVKPIIKLATQYGRYGYPRIAKMLGREGWEVNHKRVARLRDELLNGEIFDTLSEAKVITER